MASTVANRLATSSRLQVLPEKTQDLIKQIKRVRYFGTVESVNLRTIRATLLTWILSHLSGGDNRDAFKGWGE